MINETKSHGSWDLPQAGCLMKLTITIPKSQVQTLPQNSPVIAADQGADGTVDNEGPHTCMLRHI